MDEAVGGFDGGGSPAVLQESLATAVLVLTGRLSAATDRGGRGFGAKCARLLSARTLLPGGGAGAGSSGGQSSQDKADKLAACEWLQLARCLRVLEAMQLSTLSGQTCTKRSIMYSAPALFESQAPCDLAIESVTQLMAEASAEAGERTSRHGLGIVAARRGLVMGSVSWQSCDSAKTTTNAAGSITFIPPSAQSYIIHDDVSTLLVVEKETVYHALAQRFDDLQAAAGGRLLLVTGKGYPCAATRLFCRQVVDQRKAAQRPPLRVLALVDCDPHGLDILATYKLGSKAMRYAADAMILPDIAWIGVRPEQITKSANRQDVMQMSPNDHVKADSMLKTRRLQSIEGGEQALRWMQSQGQKAEIEILGVNLMSTVCALLRN